MSETTELPSRLSVTLASVERSRLQGPAEHSVPYELQSQDISRTFNYSTSLFITQLSTERIENFLCSTHTFRRWVGKLIIIVEQRVNLMHCRSQYLDDLANLWLDLSINALQLLLDRCLETMRSGCYSCERTNPARRKHTESNQLQTLSSCRQWTNTCRPGQKELIEYLSRCAVFQQQHGTQTLSYNVIADVTWL